MLRGKYWHEYMDTKENSNSNDEAGDVYEKETSDKTRGSFSEVLRFAFFILFFMQTLGSRILLMLYTSSALLHEKLDVGYKIGFLIAWPLEGRGGILLTLCLSFASWLFGKSSSSFVEVAVLAMWPVKSVVDLGYDVDIESADANDQVEDGDEAVGIDVVDDDVIKGCDEHKAPKLGMVFDSPEDVTKAFQECAKRAGFGIKAHQWIRKMELFGSMFSPAISKASKKPKSYTKEEALVQGDMWLSYPSE
ncbi:hypothetical protein Syun_001528 [Stephania yunnanensis]|uniref:Uncharacterized protein n=1 Tax=Stephania yunnanensis TaxID=152371 RepID=A0AAP0Q770_9MAGN